MVMFSGAYLSLLAGVRPIFGLALYEHAKCSPLSLSLVPSSCGTFVSPTDSLRIPEKRFFFIIFFPLVDGIHPNYTHVAIVSDGMHSSIDIEKSFSSSSSESRSASLNDV